MDSIRVDFEMEESEWKKEMIIPFLPHFSDTMIAKHCACSREYVRQIRSGSNIESPYKWSHCSTFLSEEHFGKISIDLDSNLPLEEIARKYKTSRGMLVGVFSKYNILYKKRKWKQFLKTGFALRSHNELSRLVKLWKEKKKDLL